MILISGGMGFIGLNTAKRFLDAGERVVLTYHNSYREPEFLKAELGKRAFAEKLDISSHHDVLEVARKHKATGIIHLVAPPVRSTLSAGEEYRVQMAGLINVLETARVLGMRRVTVASSSTVYSGIKSGPYTEDMPLPVDSRSPTEAFKKAWEVLALHYADRTKVDLALFRMRGVYGPLYYSMANIPSRLCHAAVKGVAPDFGTAVGAGIYGGGAPASNVPFEEDEAEFCYVKDCAAGIHAIQTAERLPHRIYNIGPGRAFKYGELAEAVKAAVPDAKIQLQPGTGPAPGPANAFLDNSRIREDLGFRPQYDARTGIADYIGWLRDNPQ